MSNIGKKFKLNSARASNVYECVGECGNYLWLKYEGAFVTLHIDCLIEHKEPQTIKGYVNVWKDEKSGKLYLGHTTHPTRQVAEKSRNHNLKRLDVIEISYTEKV